MDVTIIFKICRQLIDEGKMTVDTYIEIQNCLIKEIGRTEDE